MYKQVLKFVKNLRKGLIKRHKLSLSQTRYVRTTSLYNSFRISVHHSNSKFIRKCSSKPNQRITKDDDTTIKSGHNSLMYAVIFGGLGIGGYYYYSRDITPNTILKYWFGKSLSPNDKISKESFMRWYGSGKDIDDEIRNKFGDFMVECLETDKYKHWENDPIGCLCLIIVADQFTRNVYRGTTKAFKYDKYAQNLCLKGMDKGFDDILYVLHPVYVNFFYSPLSHSEDIMLQDLALKKHTELLKRLKDDKNGYYYKIQTMTMQHVIEHRNLILQFGRFPHRNEILGRKSSQKELDIIEKLGLNKLVKRE